MGLIGTMYNGVSGVGRMGDSMTVLADNIANMNTVAFKSSRTTFEALFNRDETVGQTGSGVLLSSVDTRFTPGNLQSTNIATDMAVSGNGFFIVKDPFNESVEFYTRDGQFKLIGANGSDGNVMSLVNQFGYLVQGYGVTEAGTVPEVINNVLIQRVAPPRQTQSVDLAVNIEEDGIVESVETTLYDRWDGTRTSNGTSRPLNDDDYIFKTSFKIFDATGTAQNITVYFDNTSKSQEKEFLVTCDPKQDKRILDSAGNRFNAGATTVDKGAGALLYGVMRFNDSGDLIGIDAWNVPADGNMDHMTSVNKIDLGRGEGYYSFPYNFSGSGPDSAVQLKLGHEPAPQNILSPAGGRKSPPGSEPVYITPQTKWSGVYDAQGRRPAEGDVVTFTGQRGDGAQVSYAYTISLSTTVDDLLNNLRDQFQSDVSLEDGKISLKDREIGSSQLTIASIAYRDASGNDPSGNPALAKIFGEQGDSFDIRPQDRFGPATIATTNYARSSVVLHQIQDGYGSGYLKDISVDSQGIISGVYSNGATLKQAQLALAKFTNLGGLVKQGGNLFLAGSGAGLITKGVATLGGFGSILGSVLEMSNVDIGKEFVNLITTQRALQANSKSITTADAIYEQLIRMIRA